MSNIKPDYIFLARNGCKVYYVGSAYTVYTEDGEYLGEAFNQFDAFSLADRGTSDTIEES